MDLGAGFAADDPAGLAFSFGDDAAGFASEAFFSVSDAAVALVVASFFTASFFGSVLASDAVGGVWRAELLAFGTEERLREVVAAFSDFVSPFAAADLSTVLASRSMVTGFRLLDFEALPDFAGFFIGFRFSFGTARLGRVEDHTSQIGNSIW